VSTIKPKRVIASARLDAGEREADVCKLAERLYAAEYASDHDDHDARATTAFKAAEAFIAMREARK